MQMGPLVGPSISIPELESKQHWPPPNRWINLIESIVWPSHKNEKSRHYDILQRARIQPRRPKSSHCSLYWWFHWFYNPSIAMLDLFRWSKFECQPCLCMSLLHIHAFQLYIVFGVQKVGLQSMAKLKYIIEVLWFNPAQYGWIFAVFNKLPNQCSIVLVSHTWCYIYNSHLIWFFIFSEPEHIQELHMIYPEHEQNPLN